MTLVSPVKTNELRALEIPPTPWGEIDNLRFGELNIFSIHYWNWILFLQLLLGDGLFLFFLQSFIFLLDPRFSF